MATVKVGYAAGTATAITCTLASLASAASRESATVDNTTNLYLDALVQVKVQTNVSAPTGDKAVYVYAWGVVDTTTPTYPDRVTGADAAITPDSPTQLVLLGTIYCAAAATSYKMSPKSVASMFGGVLPGKWGLVFTNATGNALDTTGGNFAVTYQGILATSV